MDGGVWLGFGGDVAGLGRMDGWMCEGILEADRHG